MSQDEIIEHAGQLLQAGKLVVIPTETVYGLGANALDVAAVEKIFAAKGRPSTDPLIVHVADRSHVHDLVERVSEAAEQLMSAFWPGPLTLIMTKSDRVPPQVTAGRDTVAVRMPDHELALAVIQAAGVPVAAPSANKFGRVSPTTPAHVAAELEGSYDLLVDGGTCTHGVESTILDTTSTPPRLLRPGSITVEQLESVVGPIETVQQVVSKDIAATSPGQLIGHYSPRTRVVVVDLDPVALANAAAQVGAALQGVHVLALPSDPTKAAQRLYSTLRHADGTNSDLIVAPRYENSGVGRAVNDRLFRSAHGDVVSVNDANQLIDALRPRLPRQ